MTSDPATQTAQLAMANALNSRSIDLVDAAPLHVEITRLRAELAVAAGALDLATTWLHRTEHPGIAARCAAAAKRAREGSVATSHGKDE